MLRKSLREKNSGRIKGSTDIRKMPVYCPAYSHNGVKKRSRRGKGASCLYPAAAVVFRFSGILSKAQKAVMVFRKGLGVRYI